jgi:hypothetical protein
MESITNLQALERAQAVVKGYEDGLAAFKQFNNSKFQYYMGLLPVQMARSSISAHLTESYQIGFIAAWEKTHPKSSMQDGMFPQSTPAYEQAIMRDLEES